MCTQLFKIGNWNVSISERKTELKFDNGYNCAYAFYNRKEDHLFFDRAIVPKYVQTKTKKWAIKNPAELIDIYNN